MSDEFNSWLNNIGGGALQPHVISQVSNQPGGGGGGAPGGAASASSVGGGGGAGGIGNYLAQQQQGALDANLARLQKMMQLSQSFGQNALTQNAQITGQQQSSAQQSLIGRGLGNSTVVDSVQNGIARQGQQQANSIGEQRDQMQLGILNNVQQPGPDLGLYANLLSQPGGQATAAGLGRLKQPNWNQFYGSLGGGAGATAGRFG